MIARADALRLPFADRTFNMVIGSPPYIDARLYLEDEVNPGISRDTREWVDWMLGITAEALRVSKGLVLWVVAGVTRDWNYQPGPEGLLWRWWDRGGECHCLRPVIWHRNGIPGSGGDQWFRADTEYVLAFKRPGKLPWADNTANGHTPKWAPGGEMSYRTADGQRVSFCGVSRRADGKRREVEPGVVASKGHRPSHMTHTKRRSDGSMEEQRYVVPVLANPGNFFHTGTGGGQIGSNLAHRNEAPYPVDVPKWFIASHCPPGGRVLDPFCGSGTTVDAALTLGRTGVGCDIRQSQCRLSRTRIGTVTPGFCFAEETP